MKSAHRTLHSLLLATALALPLLTAAAVDAEAGERTRKITRTGADGRQAQAVQHRRFQDGQYHATTTWTGPNGKTARRETYGTYDKDAGQWTRDTTSVGPNGKTRNTHAEVQRTDSGYTRDVVHTGPQGEMRLHTDFVRTENGFEMNKSITPPNGKTITQQTVMTYDPESHTATSVRTMTGPNGQTVTREVTRTWTPAP
jgi:hypothetical protein